MNNIGVGDLFDDSDVEEEQVQLERRAQIDDDVRRLSGPVRIVETRVQIIDASAVETMPQAERIELVDVLEIDGQPVECVICSSNVRDPIEYLVCGHIFCAGCIAQWGQMGRNCPTCRAPMVLTPIRSMQELVRWSRQRPRE